MENSCGYHLTLVYDSIKDGEWAMSCVYRSFRNNEWNGDFKQDYKAAYIMPFSEYLRFDQESSRTKTNPQSEYCGRVVDVSITVLTVVPLVAMKSFALISAMGVGLMVGCSERSSCCWSHVKFVSCNETPMNYMLSTD